MDLLDPAGSNIEREVGTVRDAIGQNAKIVFRLENLRREQIIIGIQNPKGGYSGAMSFDRKTFGTFMFRMKQVEELLRQAEEAKKRHVDPEGSLKSEIDDLTA